MVTERQMAQLSKHPEVRELLFKALPTTQPSALKHHYLTSVANVVHNPVASIQDAEGASHVIGFGDLERRSPIVLIVEPDPNRSIRHAFPPNTNYSIDMALTIELQRHEDTFATTHRIPRRNVLQEIRTRDRGDISVHGLSPYEAHVGTPPDFEDPYWANYTANFYPTDFMPREDHFVDKPVMHDVDHDDYWKMTENIATGLATTHPRASIMGIDVDNRSNAEGTSRKTMHVTSVAMKTDPNLPARVPPPRPTKTIRRPIDTINFHLAPGPVQQIQQTSTTPTKPAPPLVVSDLDRELAKINTHPNQVRAPESIDLNSPSS